MQRLQKDLMPLISIVIAFVPQGSAEKMLPLNEAGVLSLILVDHKSKVVPDISCGVIYHYYNESKQPKSTYFRTYGYLPV